MIIIQLLGGLGNQMFQYSFAKAIAIKKETNFKMDLTALLNTADTQTYTKRNYELGAFNIEQNFSNEKDLKLFTPLNNGIVSKIKNKIKPRTIFCEKSLSYDPNVWLLPKNIYLKGYWQSEMYFGSIKEILLKDFTFKKQPRTLNFEMLNLIQSVNSVSIHIRRGDYVSNKQANELHGVCKPEYYYKAVEIIKEKVNKPYLFFFSDDMKWVKENLKFDLPSIYVDINKVDNGSEDLRLMLNCKHNVLANSSLSWWSSWLNINKQKIVIAPKDWVINPLFKSDSIILKDWLRI